MKHIESVVIRNEILEKFIYNEDTRKLCRNQGSKSFTRNRKIPFHDVLLLSLNKQGKTTTFEIRDYEINKKGKNNVEYSEESYLKQRRNLNPNVFIEMNKIYLSHFYSYKEEEILKTKGYIKCSIDGSNIEIPNTPQNRKYFGKTINQTDKSVARATLSTLYDLNNKFYISSTVEKYHTNEKEMAKKNIEKALEIIGDHKLLIIFDRGYPALSFCYWMNQRGIKYLIRCASNKFVPEQRKMKTKDEIVKFDFSADRKSKLKFRNKEDFENMKDIDGIYMRMIKANIPNKDEEEILITNLTKEEFNTDEIVELYGERWGIEKKYDSIKNKLKIESFTGNLPQFVYQDIYAGIVVINQISDMINTGNKNIEEEHKTKTYKNKKQINENKAIGFFKEKMIKIMLEENADQRVLMLKELLKDIEKYTVPIRQNKDHIRYKRNLRNKYRTNMKSSF